MEREQIKSLEQETQQRYLEKYAKMRVVPPKHRNKKTCEASMQRRVNMINSSFEVLIEQGKEYRPDLYTQGQINKMFGFLQKQLDYAKQVFESGLKSEEKQTEPFKF